MSTIQLRITVQRPDKYKSGQFKEIFRTCLEYDENVTIPFSRLYDGLKLLFPYKDALVTFII